MPADTDSIYALSTPAGGAIAVVRASGPACAHALAALTGKDTILKAPRQLMHAVLSYDGAEIDDAMAVFFPGPRSYTGEDMLELHCHGGQAPLRAALHALAALGLRAAEPGEFTRRAFLNGKMDLSQAEAVMDLIESEAALSAKAALLQMQGRLSKALDEVNTLLVEALSGVNAAIDYPEELDEDVYAALPAGLAQAQALLSELIAQGEAGRVLREGFRVVLLGAPNAGKSSLLNALLGWERAIVTALPGTTRDTLEERLSLEGLPLLLTDTAGLREAADLAEGEGVRRAREAAANADAVLLLLDGTVPLDAGAVAMIRETEGAPRRVLLRTKCDLPPLWEQSELPLNEGEALLPVSALTGEGLRALRARLMEMAGPVGGVYVTNARHVQAMREAAAAIAQAQALLGETAIEKQSFLPAAHADSIATDLRDALSALGGITGRMVDEEVIDRIFERFCVGK